MRVVPVGAQEDLAVELLAPGPRRVEVSVPLVVQYHAGPVFKVIDTA